MRLLILGGTIFVGRHVVDAALARGHEVTLFNRGKTAPELYPELERLRGDRAANDYASLAGRAFDAVVDTCAYFPRAIREAAAALSGGLDGPYVFISSVSAFASHAEPDQAEDTPLATLDAPDTEEVTGQTYGGLKAACERELERLLPERALTLRPGLIVGPHDPTDRFTYWAARLARGGRILAPGDPRDPIQIIDARDLAAFTLDAIEAGARGAFNLVGPTAPLTIGALLRDGVAALSPDAELEWVGAEALERLEVAPWTDMPAWVPPVGEHAGFARVSNARAVAHGLTTRDHVTILRDTLAWWEALGDDRRAAPRAGLPPERERAALDASSPESG